MKKVFVDTFYWIEKFLPESVWREQLRTAEAKVRHCQLVTSDEVLTEFLNIFGKRGPVLRRKAAELVKALLQTSTVRVIPQTRDSFAKGLRRYEHRPDKDYSLVDCISMNHMEAEDIQEILTADHHFGQEGFVVHFRKS